MLAVHRIYNILFRNNLLATTDGVREIGVWEIILGKRLSRHEFDNHVDVNWKADVTWSGLALNHRGQSF